MGVHMPRIVLYPDESVFQLGGFCMFKTFYFSVETIAASMKFRRVELSFYISLVQSLIPSLTG